MGTGQNERLVWATGAGRIRYCTRCRQPEGACHCGSGADTAAHRTGMPSDGIVRLAREKKGRGGKVVTVVYGVPGGDEELTRLAQELKRFCGAGGTVRDAAIELQGEHRERLKPRLEALGYRVKLAGG
ncbi:MAG: hypothetical protein IVW57_12800 [Ktedonobacterales bacterium]|nr:hypothetical protein [Ktedonobacterales bacterium]